MRFEVRDGSGGTMWTLRQGLSGLHFGKVVALIFNVPVVENGLGEPFEKVRAP